MKKLVLSCILLALAIFSFGCVESECEHNYVEEKVSATCVQDGYVKEVCNKCGDVKSEKELEKTGHDYVSYRTNATCTEAGYEISVCEKCNTAQTTKIEEAKGHDYALMEIFTQKAEKDNCGKYACLDCEEEKIDCINAKDLGMPILSFSGDVSKISKENKVVVGVHYDDGEKVIEADATLKWQGATSINYPKKNFNMQLLKKGTNDKNKVILNEDWGKQSKYCLKANYIDFSQARNVVSGRIYNDIVKSRDLEDEVAKLNNGGVVDGFPILIYINGEYQGLYTLNIPKDKWMLGMDDDEEDDSVITKQAILMGETWNDFVSLEKTINSDFASCGFELEYCSTEDTVGNEWVYDSFNRVIDFVNSNDGEAFKNGIGNYINVERTIDSMLYTWLIMAADNRAKNILWATYDGIHWFSSMYDMDGVWGMSWDGLEYNNPFGIDKQGYIDNGNLLWKKIYENFEKEIIKRYFELRTSSLSTENVESHFVKFNESISKLVFEAEKIKWAEIPSKNTSNLDQILDFMYKRFSAMDEYFLALMN